MLGFLNGILGVKLLVNILFLIYQPTILIPLPFDIPIRLNTKPFKGDNAVAELILKLVTDLNNPNYTTADGEVTPFSHFGLLKVIVNFGSHTATNPEL